MQLPGDTGRIIMTTTKQPAYRLKRDRFDEKAGTTVYPVRRHDYGAASGDTHMTGVEHVSVTLDAYGEYPFFTVPVADLEPIPAVPAAADALPEASPATKGQCNDERACGACFSGQGQCETTKPAPQVTPAVVEAVIGSEHYFTADQGERQEIEDYLRDHPGEYPPFIPDPLHMITICTLVTKNGHSVVGVAYCADPAKFNAQTGRDAARADAIRQLWPMVIYAERERLAAQPNIALSYAEAQSNYDRVRWAEDLIRQLPADHEGRNSWLLNFGTAAPDLRPAASDDDF